MDELKPNEEMIYEEKDVVYMPVLPLRGLVLFPDMVLHFDVARKKSALAIESAMKRDQLLFITAQKNIEVHDPKTDDLNTYGVIAKVVQIFKQSEKVMRVVVEGIERATLVCMQKEKPFFVGEVHKIFYEEVKTGNMRETVRKTALIRTAKRIFEEYVIISPQVPKDILYKISNYTNCGQLADFITSNIMLDYTYKQEILEFTEPVKRLERLIDLLFQEVNILNIEEEIRLRAKDQIDEHQRSYYLNEQLKVIQEELGTEDDQADECFKYKMKISSIEFTNEEVPKELIKEVDKLAKMPYSSQEANVSRNYLDLCLDLPWDKSTKDYVEIGKIKKRLDKNHYGLEKVKKNILENLAVRKLAPEVKGQILCLVGPPGVGKTSIAHSIAKAINRKSQRIALGGIRDESEIRGHRRTYIGAMPGRVINALKLSKVNNPLIVLDEIDKLGNDYKGDPTSALLEVLDAEQNNSFYDHYVDLPFDLSKVMFITTANDYTSIPAPLLDRMDVIEVSSYTREEKFNIAKKHLLPKQMKNCGVSSKNLRISNDALYEIIDSYTREAGVRNLERKIKEIIRKVAVIVVEDKDVKIVVNSKNIEEYLGIKKYRKDVMSKQNDIGVCTGLAWTSVGGEVLPIEVAVVEGNGKIEITGSLGDVMKESVKIAITCVRTLADRYKIDKRFYKKYDIHVHAPEGAVPKDGPSAGITITTAIISALTKTAVRADVAMTGEITLTGKVLPIGGLKEKSMAAYRYGVTSVIMPYDNKADIEEVDEKVKESLKFLPVKHITDVLDLAFSTGPDKLIIENNNGENLKKTKSIAKSKTTNVMP